jgi:hypothetical protein
VVRIQREEAVEPGQGSERLLDGNDAEYTECGFRDHSVPGTQHRSGDSHWSACVEARVHLQGICISTKPVGGHKSDVNHRLELVPKAEKAIVTSGKGPAVNCLSDSFVQPGYPL